MPRMKRKRSRMNTTDVATPTPERFRHDIISGNARTGFRVETQMVIDRLHARRNLSPDPVENARLYAIALDYQRLAQDAGVLPHYARSQLERVDRSGGPVTGPNGALSKAARELERIRIYVGEDYRAMLDGVLIWDHEPMEIAGGWGISRKGQGLPFLRRALGLAGQATGVLLRP